VIPLLLALVGGATYAAATAPRAHCAVTSSASGSRVDAAMDLPGPWCAPELRLWLWAAAALIDLLVIYGVVLGLVTFAAGAELVIAHPDETRSGLGGLLLLGGPILYLGGQAIYFRLTTRHDWLVRAVGAGLLGLGAVAAYWLPGVMAVGSWSHSHVCCGPPSQRPTRSTNVTREPSVPRPGHHSEGGQTTETAVAAESWSPGRLARDKPVRAAPVSSKARALTGPGLLRNEGPGGAGALLLER
jgi:hypothetical protein